MNIEQVTMLNNIQSDEGKVIKIWVAFGKEAHIFYCQSVRPRNKVYLHSYKLVRLCSPNFNSIA